MLAAPPHYGRHLLESMNRKPAPKHKILRRLRLAAFFLALSLTSSSLASPVLLTWNLQTDADAEAMRVLRDSTLGRTNATYFVAGAFAERHPDLVRELAAQGTIGSLGYEHTDLTRLSEEALHRELTLGKLVLERIIEKPLTWFRAPWLKTTQRISRKLEALGFQADSSFLERWTAELHLAELPVSVSDDSHRPLSDFEFFETRELADEEALQQLLKGFGERQSSQRPLVLLLHPRIAVEHAGTLEAFRASVSAQDATFLSADQWLWRSQGTNGNRSAVWIDLSQGPIETETLLRDVITAGFSDAFVQARDPDGLRYYAEAEADAPRGRNDFGTIVKALAANDIRVHAWLSVNRDPWQASRWPKRAMVSIDGEVSRDWVSPTNDAARANLGNAVRRLVESYPLAGIHLDYLRYPDLDHDFAPGVVSAFRESYDAPQAALKELFDENYNEWVNHRSRTIRDQMAQVGAILKEAASDPSLELSAAVFADAATSYRVMETMGQDLSLLAPLADFLVPMAYVREQRRWPAWITNVGVAARYRLGDTPVLVGLEAYQRPPTVTYSDEEWAEVADQASRGFDGVAFYHYAALFGHAGEASLSDAARGSALKLLTTRASEPRELVLPPASQKPRSRWPRYAGLITVVALLALLAARGRRMRAEQSRNSQR